MNKNTLTGLLLIGLVLIGFSIYNQPSKEQLEKARQYQDSLALVADQEQQQAAQALVTQDSMNAHQALTDTAAPFFKATQGTEQTITLSNEKSTLSFSTKGGRLIQATLKDYKDQEQQPLQLFDKDNMQMAFSFDGKQQNINTEDYYFQPVAVTDTSLTMRLTHSEGRYIDFSYTLLPGTYLINLDIQATGMHNFFSSSCKSMGFKWQQRMRQLEKGYQFEQRYTQLTYKPVDKGFDYLSQSKDDDERPERALDWIGFKNQFFSSVMIADQDFRDADLNSKMESKKSGYLKDYSASANTFFDPTGQKATKLQMYVGPNKYSTLKATNELCYKEGMKLHVLVNLGWPVIRQINRWFTIPLFDWLSGWGLSMGVVILLLTIIVKILVYPALRKSFMSTAKMRALRPKIDEINKKYPNPDDALKKNQETMALYSQYGVSPMGGCLPMLLQMPVFMALFFFVPNAIELRGQSFLWAHDLSCYDAFITWNTDLPLIGNHLSLFCILFSVTNFLNMWITSRQQQDMMGGQPREGQMMMKIMQYGMPVMFFFIFNDYSSGLNYYYFISSLITILMMFYLRKTTDENKLMAQLEKNRVKLQATRKARGGQGGFMAKLAELQKEQERIEAEKRKAKK